MFNAAPKGTETSLKQPTAIGLAHLKNLHRQDSSFKHLPDIELMLTSACSEGNSLAKAAQPSRARAQHDLGARTCS
jgi:hypothetical protein